MTRVPRTVPSTPLAFIASRRQIITKEATMKRARNNQGAQAPLVSIQVITDFKLVVRGEGDAGTPHSCGRTQERVLSCRKHDSGCVSIGVHLSPFVVEVHLFGPEGGVPVPPSPLATSTARQARR